MKRISAEPRIDQRPPRMRRHDLPEGGEERDRGGVVDVEPEERPGPEARRRRSAARRRRVRRGRARRRGRAAGVPAGDADARPRGRPTRRRARGLGKKETNTCAHRPQERPELRASGPAAGTIWSLNCRKSPSLATTAFGRSLAGEPAAGGGPAQAARRRCARFVVPCAPPGRRRCGFRRRRRKICLGGVGAGFAEEEGRFAWEALDEAAASSRRLPHGGLQRWGRGQATVFRSGRSQVRPGARACRA